MPCIHKLLRLGADPKKSNKYGLTPMQVALASAHVAALEALGGKLVPEKAGVGGSIGGGSPFSGKQERERVNSTNKSTFSGGGRAVVGAKVMGTGGQTGSLRRERGMQELPSALKQLGTTVETRGVRKPGKSSVANVSDIGSQHESAVDVDDFNDDNRSLQTISTKASI